MATLRERLLARLIIDASGCLLWTGAQAGKGYGVIAVNRRMRYTHRVAWELDNGPIADGLVIDHLCRNHLCANSAHMELVTAVENVMRGIGFGPVNAAKTHCLRGHAYDEANTRVGKKGWRACRACDRDAARRYYHALAARRATSP